MSKLPHLLSRSVFCGLFLAVGIAGMREGLNAGAYGVIVCSIAVLLIGVYSFLVPFNFRVPLREMARQAYPDAIGSPRLRSALSFTIVGLLFLGLFMRWVLKI